MIIATGQYKPITATKSREYLPPRFLTTDHPDTKWRYQDAPHDPDRTRAFYYRLVLTAAQTVIPRAPNQAARQANNQESAAYQELQSRPIDGVSPHLTVDW
jgi:hypothetical protein